MTDSAFNKGDVVQLKSGGPKMTVQDTGDFSGYGAGPKEGVRCVWFEKTDAKERDFDEAVLKICERSEAPKLY